MPEERHSVAITGIGAVSSFGRGIERLWQALTAGAVASTEWRGGTLVAPVPGYAPPPNLDPDAAARLGRCSLFAVDATIQAVEDARLPFTAQGAPLIGLAFSSEVGDPELPIPGSPGTSLARVLGIAGPVLSLRGPGSGALAIAEAAESIRRGAAPVMIAGGAEMLSDLLLGQGSAALSNTAARPFDAARDGVVPGEGAAAVILEDADLARERGARVYAELLGGSTTFSRATVMRPAMNHVDAARALQAALLRAEVYQGEVDLLCASANGDPAGDEVEVRALTEIWGPNVDRLTVTSVHGALGHTFAAAGPLSLVAAIKALESGLVPPAVGLTEPDQGFPSLDIVQGTARHYRAATAVVNAFSLGANVCLVIRIP